MNQLEAKLKKKILEFSEGDLSTVTPSLQIQAFHKGKLKADLKLGKKYKYYDLASLTKIFFTTLAIMRLTEKRTGVLRTPFSKIAPDFKAEKVNVTDLLTHTAGLEWWHPFYKELSGPKDHQERWKELRAKLKAMAPVEREKAVYSDIDFLFIGVALEYFTKKDLLANWEELHKSAKLKSLHFCVNNIPKFKTELYAPTEACPWRNKILQGEVHDDNTWALGGVAPQAGLFGNIDDVSELVLRLRKVYRGGRDSLVKTATLKKFTSRKTPKNRGDWGLGFMLPTQGSASSGQYFSPQSFGHTGFAGTSFWYDPKKDWAVVILSNRIHPTRDNKKFVSLRPLIHDWIVEPQTETKKAAPRKRRVSKKN